MNSDKQPIVVVTELAVIGFSVLVAVLILIMLYSYKQFFKNNKNNLILSLCNENSKKLSFGAFICFSILALSYLALFLIRNSFIDIASITFCFMMAIYWFFLATTSYKASKTGIFLILGVKIWSNFDSWHWDGCLLKLKTKKGKIYALRIDRIKKEAVEALLKENIHL